MRFFCLGAIFTASIGVSLSLAQGEKKKTPNPNEVEVRLVDGSKVRMTLLHDSLEVVTKFGKLTVPTAEIRRIEFGLHPDSEAVKKIEAALKRLSDDNAHVREAASKELVAMGALSYGFLVKAARSADAEVVRLARLALEQIREKMPDGQLAIKEDDQVQTTDFTIVGRVKADSIKARSPVFGETLLKPSELRGIRWVGRQAEVEISVDGAKYCQLNQWLDSGIDVEEDDELSIAASGQINLNDQGDGRGQFVTGPAGNKQWGQQQPNQVPGCLYGRIGETNAPFAVADKYHDHPRKAGRLYLNIGLSPWGQGTNVTGAFKVKIQGGRDSR